MRRGLARTVLVVVVLASWSTGTAQTAPPAHLELVSATIDEVPPIDSIQVAGRGISLRIELEGLPPCSGAVGFLDYGFLVDTDRNPDTGLAIPGVAIGIEAQLSARCDPTTGLFTSPVGGVSLTTDGGTGNTTLEILTSVGMLPSLNFDWVAFAVQNGELHALPGHLPEQRSFRPPLPSGHFATHEITRF